MYIYTYTHRGIRLYAHMHMLLYVFIADCAVSIQELGTKQCDIHVFTHTHPDINTYLGTC